MRPSAWQRHRAMLRRTTNERIRAAMIRNERAVLAYLDRSAAIGDRIFDSMGWSRSWHNARRRLEAKGLVRYHVSKGYVHTPRRPRKGAR